MTRSAIRHFTRDDQETEVEVEYELTGGSDPSGEYGPPENYDPGSSPEMTVTKPDDLTEAELERFEEEVMNDPDSWPELDHEPDYD